MALTFAAVTGLPCISYMVHADTALNPTDRITPMKAIFDFKSADEIARENKWCRKNPFGLLYEGAVSANEPGKVQVRPIAYDNNGIRIAANIYTPADWSADGGKIYPAVCVAHPNGGVKEQVAGLYAQKLAERGFITIAADASYQGGSGGEPRYLDLPSIRTEDIRRMADVIARFPGVDANRISLLGICGGGGYAFNAAKTDKRFKAVATLSAFNTGLVRREGFLGTQKDTVAERLRAAAKQREAEAAGAPVAYTANMLDWPKEKGLALTQDLYRDGYEYYGLTHRHPRSTFSATVTGLLEMAIWDARDGASLIDQPLLMIAGDKADTLYLTQGMFNAATGTKDKELHLIPGAHHIETYWKPEYVSQIDAKLGTFFSNHLGSASLKTVSK